MERKCANCGNASWRDGKTPITDICIQCRYVDMDGHPEPSNWKPQHMTNADRIRSMSDEELAKLIVKHKPAHSWCKGVREIWMQPNVTKIEAWVKWLQSPAEEK